MSQNIVLQNLGIAIAIRNHNPAILTQEFLKYSDIVPEDWELAREPIAGNQGSQVVYRNGVTLTAQQEILSFVEIIGAKTINDIQASNIAHKYVKALPNLEYQALGIDVRGYITASQLSEGVSAQSYLNSLLAPAPWREIGQQPVKASVQLVFSLAQGQFSLGINEGVLYVSEEETVPIVLFNGNFSYRMSGNKKEERLESLHQLIDNWQRDINTYQEIINTKFLGSQVVLQDAPDTSGDKILIPS